jgi:hypothetical protein
MFHVLIADIETAANSPIREGFRNHLFSPVKLSPPMQYKEAPELAAELRDHYPGMKVYLLTVTNLKVA